MDEVAEIIFKHFRQSIDPQNEQRFTMNMARLYWFQASCRMQELEDGEVSAWVKLDAFMNSVPMALVQTNLRRSTCGLHHERNRGHVQHMWALCEKMFISDGDHWSLRPPAAREASGTASDAVACDDEELPDLGDSSEDEPVVDHASSPAIMMEFRLPGETLISPARPVPTDRPIRWTQKDWVKDLSTSEESDIHDMLGLFFNGWKLTGADIARESSLEDVEHLKPQRRLGSFPWNEHSDKPAPHMRRDKGLRANCGLQGGAVGNKFWNPWVSALGGIVGWVSPLSGFLEVFRTWIHLRPEIACRVHEIRPVSPRMWESLHIRKPGYTIGQTNPGYWLRMTLKGTQREPNEVYGGDAVRGWHGTSMYCISRVIHRMGLTCGFARNSQGGSVVQGVFYMHAAQAHLCEGYMHYCMLNDDGWLVAPLLELCVDEQACRGTMKTVLKRKNKNTDCTQRIAADTCVRLHSVFFHVMHVSELINADKALWLVAEPGFHPLLELDPEEPWEDIVERSLERRHLRFM